MKNRSCNVCGTTMIPHQEKVPDSKKTQIVWRCPNGCDVHYDAPFDDNDDVTKL